MLDPKRLVEFFEGDNKRLSMTRLLCFLSFFPASFVVVWTKNETALGWYLSAYVLGYVGGKVTDMVGRPRSRGEHPYRGSYEAQDLDPRSGRPINEGRGRYVDT